MMVPMSTRPRHHPKRRRIPSTTARVATRASGVGVSGGGEGGLGGGGTPSSTRLRTWHTSTVCLGWKLRSEEMKVRRWDVPSHWTTAIPPARDAERCRTLCQRLRASTAHCGLTRCATGGQAGSFGLAKPRLSPR